MATEEVKRLWEENESSLVAIASDEDLFADYLALMGQHPGETPMNLASIQAHGDYRSKAVLKTRDEWDDVLGVVNGEGGEYRTALKDDAEGIPVVRKQGYDSFRVEYLYPIAALERRPAPDAYLGLPMRIDLGRNEDQAVFSAAARYLAENKGVDLDALPDNALYAVQSRYGMERTVEPTLPSLDFSQGRDEAVRQLKEEIGELREKVGQVAFLLDRSLGYNRRQFREGHAAKAAPLNPAFSAAAGVPGSAEGAVPEPDTEPEPEPEHAHREQGRNEGPVPAPDLGVGGDTSITPEQYEAVAADLRSQERDAVEAWSAGAALSRPPASVGGEPASVSEAATAVASSLAAEGRGQAPERRGNGVC